MKILKNKYLWFLVSTVIIASIIYFADFSKFLEALQTADLVLLAPAFLFGMAVFPVWSYVWYEVFTTCGIHTNYYRALKIFMAGFFMNSITPLGQFGGEPIMAYIVKDEEGVKYEKAISSVFSADVVNAIPVLTFGLGGAAFALLFRSINEVVVQGLYIALIVIVIGGPLMYFLWFESEKLKLFLDRLIDKLESWRMSPERAESLKTNIDETLETFRVVGESPVELFKVGAVAHLGFLLQVFCFFFIMWSLGHQPDLTPIYFVIALGGLANFSPTPGGSGTFEAATAGLVTVFFPVSFTVGVTAAILYRLTTYWPGLVIGYFTLNSLNGGR